MEGADELDSVQTPTAEEARDQSHHLVYGMLARVTLDGQPVVPLMTGMEGLPYTRLVQLVEDRLSQIVHNRSDAERVGKNIVASLLSMLNVPSAPSTRIEITDLLVPALSDMLAALGLPSPMNVDPGDRPLSRRGRRA
jgi:hypothetical protein